jgi:hypothetical protein
MTERKRPPSNMGDPSNLDVAAEIAAAAANPQAAPDMTGGEQLDGPGEAYDVAELGPDCPITPLGFLKQKFYFLDFAGQLIELGSEFRKGELMALFGTRMGWLDVQWPQWKKVGEKDGRPIFEQDGFSQKVAQQGLIMACSKRRLFDPKRRVRGRGAHLGDDGELVLHCGDAVLVGGRKGVKGRAIAPAWFKSGEVGRYIYPTFEAIARPHDVPASSALATQVLACLETWNWQRGAIAAHLLLCWLAAAMVGGALRIRPNGWIVGPSGAGKTTLQQFLRELMGDWGVFTEDATEAGVRQLLDQDTLAVMFDEIEAEDDNREVTMRIVRLARLAYSGSSSLRGTSEQQAKQFVARSCFLFSSIHHQELPAQDRNRIAILQLSKFPPKTPQFLIPGEAREWGDRLRRRLIEQWPRFAATLAAFQSEMLAQGYEAREQDTYGFLLACGDLLLHDAAPDALSLGESAGRVHGLVRSLGAIVDAARAEAENTTERCIKHLASHRLPAKGGEAQETVARWIQKLLVRIHAETGADLATLRQRLSSHGLRVVHLARDHAEGNGQGGLVDAYALMHEDRKRVPMWLAVAHPTNKGAKEIFAGSFWQGGIWPQSLALAEGAWNNKKSRFGGSGSPDNCVLVPLELVADVTAAIEEAELLRAQPSFPAPPPAA